MDMTVVGEKIKQLRINRGINQIMLADFLGVDQSLISKIEKGSRNITIDLLVRLSNLFGVPLEYFDGDSSIEETLSFAFRGNELTTDDMEAICAVNKIALNIENMNALLKESNK